MNGLARETRLQIMLSSEELAALDDWRFTQRMPSRAAAIRHLLRLGLEAAISSDSNRPTRSQDFGVVRDADEERS
ncbi:hypothetical protein [Hyphomicrobium sp. 1Nfss2.1]|uniref:hypothetical protein n=1 Tax=Hyphomicrobium sp. 1Nfss2.1 TaxID=3413936 RepID=UPI003C7A9CE5